MEWLQIDKKKQKDDLKKEWHCWFAWYPITLKIYKDGTKHKIWLKTVSRKGRLINDYDSCWWVYKYKLKED